MAKVAMIVGPGFEDSEYRVPYRKLTEKGHEVEVLGADAHQTLEGKKGEERVKTEAAASQRDPSKYDAIVIPGGHGPDALRIDAGVVRFVKGFVKTGKPIAAVCHGPQLLIEAEAVDGRTMTSWPSVKTDLVNAGAKWEDREVVEDDNFITSRKPSDLEAFSNALLARL